MIRDLARILGSRHRGALRSALLWAIIYGALQGLSVVFLVPIATALAAGHYALAGWWLGALAVAVAVSCLGRYRQAMTGFGVALTLLRTMHRRFGDHLVRLPLGWFGADTVGRVSQIAVKGSQSLASSVAHLLGPVVSGVTGPAVIVVAMLALDWRLGLALLAFGPIAYLAALLSARLIADAEHGAHEAAVETNNRVLEYARCQPVLRAFGRTAGVYRPLDDAIEQQRRAGRRGMWASVTGMVLGGATVQLAFTVVIVLGVRFALDDTITPIKLVALLGVTARFIQPLNDIGQLGGALRTARSELRRMADVLETPVAPEPATSTPISAPGLIELDRVSFGYAAGLPVLREVSLLVEPGTMTALVGPSGSGKTTVTRLISRFYDVDAGTVRVGGVDVRDQTTADLMAQLALVFQDVYLFDDTLLENIRFGRPGATDDEVRAAATLAGVDEIVDRLPSGWRSPVGEAGSALSGGERQRVSIARALLKNAPIVLLDEATAALDPENETYVQHAVRQLRTRATVLVIAHKLSTVTAADRIVVLAADGAVAETGTHDSLLAAGGRYREFWEQRTRAAGWALAPTT